MAQVGTVRHLYRYPVKGLSAEALQSVELSPGRGFPLDRVFALALGSTAFDESRPKPLAKTKFLMLRRDEVLATLATSFASSDPRQEGR